MSGAVETPRHQVHACDAKPLAVTIVRDPDTGRWVEWNRDEHAQMERVTTCRYCREELR